LNRKALISVKTLQFIDGQPESIELVTEGEYYKEGSNYFAVYNETEISGMDGTMTTLKIDEDSLTIIRKGTTNSNLVFKRHFNHISLYNTPYGTLEVTVRPSKVQINVDDNGGKVELKYKMEAPGLEVVENELELNIKHIN
jgi:uncharacterized beta-barrel protein YwiB (DUF1934 family)